MKKAVILVADNYQDLEVWYPFLRLKEAGWKVVTAGTQSKKSYVGKIGYPLQADTSIEEVSANDFDAVIVPGGWAPDAIRRNQAALKMVREMNAQGKIVAAICHAGWVLSSADILKRANLHLSVLAIKDDMAHAGANWQNAEVVIDKNLVTSRTPDDLPAFCRAILEVAER